MGREMRRVRLSCEKEKGSEPEGDWWWISWPWRKMRRGKEKDKRTGKMAPFSPF